VTSDTFLKRLQAHAASFAKAVATKEGEWIIKGFIDIYRRVYTISVDTKIVSKVLELLLFPMFVEFAEKNGLDVELCPYQNFYPDLTFIHKRTGNMFAVDIKSTYRKTEKKVNGMTLGAFTGYFRQRNVKKMTCYPYNQYAGHFVLGVIYTKCEDVADERTIFRREDLEKIPSVIRDFAFFVQPKYRIASWLPGSGNTKNIGSATDIDKLINGTGPFASLGEAVYDDYWMFYLTEDMANKLEVERPYADLTSYAAYKKRGSAVLERHAKEIAKLGEEEAAKAEEES
jgi:hypothetical protein